MKCDCQHAVGLLRNLSCLSGHEPTKNTKIKTDDMRIKNTNNQNLCIVFPVLDKPKNGQHETVLLFYSVVDE